MWELDLKKAKHQRIDGFELWCSKRLDSPLDGNEIKLVNPKGNQPSIFVCRTDAEVTLQYFGHLIQRANSLAKILMLGKTESSRGRGCNG